MFLSLKNSNNTYWCNVQGSMKSNTYGKLRLKEATLREGRLYVQ